MSGQKKIIGTVVSLTLVASLVIVACTRQERTEERAAERAKLSEARENLAKEVERYIVVTENVAEPLTKLNEEQIASVVALSYIARSVELAHSPNTRLPGDAATQFKERLGSISSGLGRVAEVKSPIFACFDQSVACASALASCENEDPPRSEEECFESRGLCAQEIMCVMRELEAMRVRINDIFRGLRPPKPIPWPE